MAQHRVARIEKECVVCGGRFVVGGRSGPLTRKYCSQSCATTNIHKQERERSYARNTRPHKFSVYHDKATERPTLRDIAWAGGFFEGEGSCIRWGRNECRVHIGQKNRWPLDRMLALFGGRISESEMNGAPFYDWHMSGARGRGFLMTIYTFLSPRRQEQAHTAWV